MNDETREFMQEWLAKAAEDRQAATILAAHGGSVSMIGFHCQQYVEKLLKAFLTLREVEAPRTHDLNRLIGLASPSCQDLARLAEVADIFTEFAVEERYPGDRPSASTTDPEALLDIARQFADLLLPLLEV